MDENVKVLCFLFFCFLLFIGLVYAIASSLNVPSVGVVETVNVSAVWVSNGTEVTQINWGTVPNGSVYVLPELIEVRNTGNTPVTLSLSTVDLSSNILSLALSWNYTGVTLQPNDSVVVELTQTVTVNSTTSFSYTLIITGVG